MKNFSETLTFTFPLGSKAHTIAKQFWRQQDNPQKAKQVYLNTLAVYAVNFYLNCMGVQTNWDANYYYSIRQILADVGDLEIPELGLLTCCPVSHEMRLIDIPPEAWSDRIGYVAVQFDESLRMATLLGFSETAEMGKLFVSQLRSLEDLLAHLSQLSSSLKTSKSQVKLTQWLNNIFEVGWQSLENVLDSKEQNLAFSFRGNSDSIDSCIKRAKLIDLGLEIENQSLVLLVAITPETAEKVSILVQVHPMQGESYLPPNLQLSMLSESGKILQEVGSRSADNYIQLKRFRGLPGESFQIKLTFGEASLTEDFLI